MMNQPYNIGMNFNMNNMNMNQAMMNMNNMMNTNFNMNQQAQFLNMINSNPQMLMIWNQMMNQAMMMGNNGMLPNQNMGNMNNFGNMQTPANMQNFQNMANNFRKSNEYQININFMDIHWNKYIIIADPNEPMSSVINKYMNKSNDIDLHNMYLFNGKNVVQSLTVSELGVMDGSEIYVVKTKGLRGAF